MDVTYDSDGGDFQDTGTFLVKGPDDDRLLKLKKVQMSCTTLGRIFKLVPDSIILYGSDDSVVVPCSSGTFDLSSFLTWKITGDALPNQAPKFNPFAFSTGGGSGGAEDFLPGPSKRYRNQKKSAHVAQGKFSSGTASGVHKEKSESSFTKNFVICEFSDGALLEIKSTTLSLCNDTTTRDIKRLLIQESDYFKACKSEGSVTLLDSKGLEIENTTATKGRTYWGTNRKIKAVRTSDWFKSKRKGLNLPTSTSSSSENESVRFREGSPPVTLQSLYKGVTKIEELVKDLSKSKSTDDIAAIFKCKICFETSKHPVLTTKCCLNVAGCYECIKKCDNMQSCILCRAVPDEYDPMGMYSEMPPVRGIYNLAGIDLK
ncbi:uncharacterized protein LOC119732905 [Patiria miniata]|uniref:RING-type domain-containing protein n=1 Tax=Patiria miniata TaxID=46514 RepID=A0A914AGB0_PATMI|nr:uncharacterized protein LOC119732905 [Patiria miniata]